MGAGPIPWSVIHDYGRTYEFDGEQMDDLMYFIRHMDNTFLTFHAEKK